MDNDIRAVFLYECRQQLGELQQHLLDAESGDGFTRDRVAELFRLTHTLKGSAAMMGYDELSDTAHRFENALSWMRKRAGRGGVPEETLGQIVTLGLSFSETYEKYISQPAEIGTENLPDLTGLNAGLDELTMKIEGKPEAAGESAADVYPPDLADYTRLRVRLKRCAMSAMRAYLFTRAVLPLCERLYTIPANLNRSTDCDERVRREGFELGYVRRADVADEQILRKLREQALFESLEPIAAARAEAVEPELVETMLSVRARRVTDLMDNVTEALAAEALLARRLNELGVTDAHTERLMRDLRRIMRGLEGGLGDLGLVELKQTFLPMQRLARMLLSELGKRARVVLTGGEVMVDRGVLEAMNEALLHLLRNAVDHGIEPPAERIRAGKPEEGRIEIAAKRERERLIVTVTDDGCGVSRLRVLEKARERKLLTKPEAEYTRKELYDFLLQSGFTTQDQLSRYSGRGVGLDAVNHALQKIGGRLELDSEEGRGSVITLNMPLSLSTMEVLRVSAAETTYYLPISVIYRVVMPESVTMFEADGTAQIADGRYQLLRAGGLERARALMLFGNAAGGCYLPCETISTGKTVLARKLPQCAVELLGDDNCYLGCAMDTVGRVVCILDVDRLIRRRKEESS